MENKENLKFFSKRLREIREAKKLSQDDLGRRAGLQASAISHFENERRLPSFDNIKNLADALNMTIDYLLGRTNDPKGMGPLSDALFRDFERLSSEDQETIRDFVRHLAEKKNIVEK